MTDSTPRSCDQSTSEFCNLLDTTDRWGTTGSVDVDDTRKAPSTCPSGTAGFGHVSSEPSSYRYLPSAPLMDPIEPYYDYNPLPRIIPLGHVEGVCAMSLSRVLFREVSPTGTATSRLLLSHTCEPFPLAA
jgi:hypothetical protein